MSDLESVMAYEAGLAHGQAERTRLETRVAELEAEVKALKPYRYLHPGIPEDLNRYREAIEGALRHLSPTFESDPPSVKDATEILRRALALQA